VPENSQELHEDPASLSVETTDKHRAIASIMEELEAVDWYSQRVEAIVDGDLAAILAHNRDEEKEHAAMVIEWLRRHDDVFDKQLRTYLFTTVPVTEVEDVVDAGGGSPATSADGSLGIGSLRGRD
jgi:ferritin-like protein